MGNDTESPGEPFGSLTTESFGRFGTVRGGTVGGGFFSLLQDADRERGFFSDPDRRFLLTSNWDGGLSESTERNTRLRIRNRILSSFFDARYLRYLSPRDRRKTFENAGEARSDLHFREGFKEFVRFTYLGLLEQQVDEIDTDELIATAIREAHHRHGLSEGRNLSVDVHIDVDVTEPATIEELEHRYEQRAKLSRDDLAALVNSWHTSKGSGVDAGEITLADALYYDARQPESDPYGYSWSDPDREAAEETVEWLRSFFREYEIDTYDQLETAIQRLDVLNEELAGELKERLNKLPRLAPNFTEQMAVNSRLSEPDLSLLHDLVYNPDHQDVERVLLEEVRPRTAGEDWMPATDEYLQKFISRVEVARELGHVFSPHESRLERWEKVLSLADFDSDEWGDYIDEQRVKQSARELAELAETHGIPLSEFGNADSWDEIGSLLPGGLRHQMSQVSLERVVERLLDDGTSLADGTDGGAVNGGDE